jgi:hypothetical protein
VVNDPLAIPDFLRAFNIRKPLLDAAIQAVSKAGDEELAQKLKDISILPRFKAALTEPLVADIPTCSPNKKVRLTRKLKEDTAIRICQLIDDGHNTYARLKKIISDERVLKSSIRYGLTHNMYGTKIVKISPRTYGVERRKK